MECTTRQIRMESTPRQSFEPISLESFSDVEHVDLQEIQKEKEETLVSSQLDSFKDSIFEETVETFKVKEQELGSGEILDLKESNSDEIELNAKKSSNLKQLDFEKVSKQELDSEDSWKPEASPTKRLKWAILLCILLFIIQFIGGWISASLALTADAFHMLSDALGYIVSLTAIHFAKSKPSLQLPWGKKRFEVIGAFLSVLIMWILCVVLLIEAYDRFSNPQPIDGKAMLGMAIGGVFFNGILIFIFGHDHENSLNRHHEEGENESEEKNLFLHKSFLDKNQWKLESSFDQSLQNSSLEKNQFSKNEIEKSSFQEIALSTDTPFSFDSSPNPLSVPSKDINIRAAMLHAIGDLLCSLGVFISALVIVFDPTRLWIDPLCTFFFSIVSLTTTIPILSDIFSIFLQATPSHLCIHSIEKKLLKINGIVSITNIKCWQLTQKELVASIQITCFISSVSQIQEIVGQVKAVMRKEGVGESNVEITL